MRQNAYKHEMSMKKNCEVLRYSAKRIHTQFSSLENWMKQWCRRNITHIFIDILRNYISESFTTRSHSFSLPYRPEDLHRIRVEHMERQLANLTGLVQKALTQNVPDRPPSGAINPNYLAVTGQYRGGKLSGRLTF